MVIATATAFPVTPRSITPPVWISNQSKAISRVMSCLLAVKEYTLSRSGSGSRARIVDRSVPNTLASNPMRNKCTLSSSLRFSKDTNNELIVHQSSSLSDLSSGFSIVPSTKPNFFLALKAVRSEIVLCCDVAALPPAMVAVHKLCSRCVFLGSVGIADQLSPRKEDEEVRRGTGSVVDMGTTAVGVALVITSGLAATNRPATPPPTTRPSGLAKETLMPPDLLRVPPLSLGMNDPDKDNISNRPCINKESTGFRRLKIIL
ncbi:uncharacterized protein G2W53_019526 [Senna tora]|uniref:Uncharacterized protein n=1 Tax=Senna tora TaxID=362788 RepID=A0A834TU83_9FABA|nr:uncharacterized protein G2W53_019526 [Senna tora]